MDKKENSVQFKAKVALEAIKGEETIRQIASHYGALLGDFVLELYFS